MFVYILLAAVYLSMGKWLDDQPILRPILKALPIFWLAYTVFGEWGLVIALLLSAAGDITLEFEAERSFMAGVGFFLLAHVAYVVQMAPFQPSAAIWLLVPLILYGGGMVRLLLPMLGSLRIPVLVYVAVILSMGVAAILHTPPSLLVIVGAFVFIFSDSVIAVNKFVRPIPQRDYIVMISYYLAQWLLVTGLQ